MRSVGVCVYIKSKGRPGARVVVLDGSWEAPQVAGHFELTSTNTDTATVLYDLGSGLRSHLSGQHAERVVVRRADVGIASRKEGPKIRLLAEGALASAARSEIADVIVAAGKDLAARSPAESKADLDAAAEGLGLSDHVEAAAAALSGLIP